MKTKFILFFLVVATFSVNAQKITIDTLSIENQFDKIFKISTTYNNFKVIRSSRYQELKKNAIDSLNYFKHIEASNLKIIENNEKDIKKLTVSIDNFQQEIEMLKNKQDSISFVGVSVSKSTFQTIFWLTTVILLILLVAYIYKFLNSFKLTKKAKNNFFEVEKEFEQFKKRTIENEQRLRRKLQDEINKQRNA